MVRPECVMNFGHSTTALKISPLAPVSDAQDVIIQEVVEDDSGSFYIGITPLMVLDGLPTRKLLIFL